MLDFILLLVSSLFANIVTIHIFAHILETKIDYKDIRFWLIFFVASLLMCVNGVEVDLYKNFKIITSFMVFSIENKLIFKKDIRITILATIAGYFSCVVTEILFMIPVLLVGMEIEPIIEYALTYFVPLTALLITISTKYFDKAYAFLTKHTAKIDIVKLILVIIILLMFFTSPYKLIVYDENIFYTLVFFIIIFGFLIILIFNSLKVKGDLIETKSKYQDTLNSLIEYENIIDKYRVDNHENKNQLMIIRNMISKNDETTVNYIDNLINNRLKDNDYLMMQVASIPSGGLKASIYNKLLLMDDKKIEYDILIDKGLRQVELTELGSKLIFNICRIVSVFLDNAIEEVERGKQLKRKDNYVTICLGYEENKMSIEIGNTTCGYLEIAKFDEAGYTTKDDGHGYGLILAKQIIAKETRLKNTKYVSADFFTQYLEVDLTKEEK